jgi:cobalt-zinc-cadmium efflux system outer membrane protein
VEAATLAERAATRRRVPEPEVVAGTKASDAGTGTVGAIFGVHLNIPLFDRAASERAAALAKTAELQAEADLFTQQLRTHIAAWRATVVERREIADRYRSAVAANAEQIERIAQVSYDAGERGILDVLDAYRTNAIARVRQATLDASVREAEIELAFVSGWESR